MECPLAKTKVFCHFKQRIQRIPAQLSSKVGASSNWEDEKFSYIVIQKTESDQTSAKKMKSKQEPNPTSEMSRVLFTPLKRGRHVSVDLCDVLGKFHRQTVPKSKGREIYRSVRLSNWGDLLYISKEDLEYGNQIQEKRNANLIVQKAQQAEAKRVEDEIKAKQKKQQQQQQKNLRIRPNTKPKKELEETEDEEFNDEEMEDNSF